MTLHLLDAMAREGFEEVLALYDRASGLRGFLAIHDTGSGPAFGGIRRVEYRSEEEGLLDCLRLARAMTHKCVLADLPAGGAKMVLLDRDGVDWEAGYRAVGDLVERQGGRFYTGPDVNTGPEHLAQVASRTRFVTDPGPEGPGLLGESTAQGVYACMGAALEHMDGAVDWSRRRIVVQGLGVVGLELARILVAQGAEVLASELQPERCERAEAELGIEILAPEKGLGTDCDVFAPCALGGILHGVSAERLRCRAVVGAANNVLARSLHGDRLHERGILYVPDVVTNAGALIRGTLFHLEGKRVSPEEIGARVAETAKHVLEAARDAGRPPARVAASLAEARLESRRGPS